MTNAFNGIRVIDTTHVLAGPFASYQLAVLGAEVIKVESPAEPDQARSQGSDRSLNDREMGTAFLSQASNKKALSLDLKTSTGVDALKRLIATADVFVENYRPGAMDALGLSYAAMSKINPRLIYCSISAFGSSGPKKEFTAYDNVIQAFSGMMEMTGDKLNGPYKSGAPVIDYATGTTAAFAIASALFQRERSGGVGQFIDVAMLDVAMILCSSHIVGFTRNGKHPERKGNSFPFATIGCYQASDYPVMISASNLRQQRRLWAALGRPDLVKHNNNDRLDAYEVESKALSEIISHNTADYWENFLHRYRVPAARIRRMEEALRDPHLVQRGFLQKVADESSQVNGLVVPVSAVHMSASPPRISTPPQPVGAQSHEILTELGFNKQELQEMVMNKVTSW
jgi:crotonobetainyl-CoA:carnitine CoA-transferase CaiB-like acyl-CoA transferase